MGRIATTVTEFNLTTAETLVYESPSIHLETAVSFVNNGAETIEIRFPGQTTLFPLGAGKAIRANAAGKVYARASATTSVLVVGFGIEPVSFGSTAAGAMTPAEVAILAESRTKKEILAELLVEARIANQHLAKLTDEQVTAADLDRDTVVIQN
jgi:hypothetical protein